MAASLEGPPLDGPYLPQPSSELNRVVNDSDTIFLYFSVEGERRRLDIYTA